VAKRDVEVEICDIMRDARAMHRECRAECPHGAVRQRARRRPAVRIRDGSDITTDDEKATLMSVAPPIGLDRRRD